MGGWEHRRALTETDRLDVARVGFAAFGSDLPLVLYTARALQSPLRQRATWWLTRSDGAPVASLLCYDLELARGERRVAAFGLGSVAVRPDLQRQGLATALCTHVAEVLERPGVLFSAVPPRVYEGMGYRALTAHEHVATDLDGVVASGPQAVLEPMDPRVHLDRLAEVWAARQPGWRLARSREYWLFLCDYPGTLWFLVPGGYLCLYREDDALEVAEVFAADRPAVLRACAALARELGKPKLQGWFESSDFVRDWFEDEGRAKTRPMVRGLPEPHDAWFSSLDYF